MILVAMYTLKTEAGSSGKAASVLNHEALSPTQGVGGL